MATKLLERRSRQPINDSLDQTVSLPTASTASERADILSSKRHTQQRLDQFYTKPEVARRCYDFLLEVLSGTIGHKGLFWIEPSAGAGDFYDLLPRKKRLGIDIDPKRDEIIKQDFLTWNPIIEAKDTKRTVVVGNPPFGHRSRMAIRFFNKAAEMSSTIAMIVPVQFRKYSVHNNLDQSFQWIAKLDLPTSAFYTSDTTDYRLNTEFQVWTKETNHSFSDMRLYQPPPVRHTDFEMWQYNNTEQALKVFRNDFDFAVPRQGYKDYTRKETDPDKCERTTQWILFKAHRTSVLRRLLSIDFEALSQNNTITPGFGKADVVKEYVSMCQ